MAVFALVDGGFRCQGVPVARLSCRVDVGFHFSRVVVRFVGAGQ
jgi:hypothetical protein